MTPPSLLVVESSIQIRFKIDNVKSVQVIAPPIRNQTAKNSIQLSITPIFARVGAHTQLVSQDLGDPLCQLDWKKLQLQVEKGAVPAAGILEYLVVPLVAPSYSKDLLLQQHNVLRWNAVNEL